MSLFAWSSDVCSSDLRYPSRTCRKSMCPVMNSLSLLCATNSSLFPLLRRQNCRGHCRGYDYSPSTVWNAPQIGRASCMDTVHRSVVDVDYNTPLRGRG